MECDANMLVGIRMQLASTSRPPSTLRWSGWGGRGDEGNDCVGIARKHGRLCMTLVIALLNTDDKVEQHGKEQSSANEWWTDQVVKVTGMLCLDQRHPPLIVVQTPQQRQDCNTSVDSTKHFDGSRGEIAVLVSSTSMMIIVILEKGIRVEQR